MCGTAGVLFVGWLMRLDGWIHRLYCIMPGFILFAGNVRKEKRSRGSKLRKVKVACSQVFVVRAMTRPMSYVTVTGTRAHTPQQALCCVLMLMFV